MRAIRLCRCARGLGICLFENTHDFGFEFREIHGEHNSPGVQDQVVSRGNERDMAAQRLAHAALDAIAVVGFAQHLTRGEADAGADWARDAFCGRLGSQEPAH